MVEVVQELRRLEYCDMIGGITDADCTVWWHAIERLLEDDSD